VECEAFPWTSRRRQHEANFLKISVVDEDRDSGVRLFAQLCEVSLETTEESMRADSHVVVALRGRGTEQVNPRFSCTWARRQS
jgi:hypothetical protein